MTFLWKIYIIIINDIPHYYLYKILSIYPLNLLKKLYKKLIQIILIIIIILFSSSIILIVDTFYFFFFFSIYIWLNMEIINY